MEKLAKAKTESKNDENKKQKAKKAAKSTPNKSKKMQKNNAKNNKKPEKNIKKQENNEISQEKIEINPIENNEAQNENKEKIKPKKIKEKKVKPKKERPLYFEKVKDVSPILQSTPTDESQTMYFDEKSGKPLYGPKPLYIDPITSKPVFSANQSGVKVVEKTIQVTKSNQKIGFSVASTAFFIAGLLFFSICYFVVSLSANTEYGIFWGITILSWLFGPIMIMIIPPLFYVAGLVFMFISFFKSPGRIYSWICIPINLVLLAGGIYLMATYLPNFL